MEYLSEIFIGLPVAPNSGMGFLYLKTTKWRTAHPEGVTCPTPTSMGPISAGRGRVISGRLANRFGSRFATSTKLLSTVFDEVILACAGAAETMPPPPQRSPWENLQLVQVVAILSLRV